MKIRTEGQKTFFATDNSDSDGIGDIGYVTAPILSKEKIVMNFIMYPMGCVGSTVTMIKEHLRNITNATDYVFIDYVGVAKVQFTISENQSATSVMRYCIGIINEVHDMYFDVVTDEECAQEQERQKIKERDILLAESLKDFAKVSNALEQVSDMGDDDTEPDEFPDKIYIIVG